MRSLISLFVAVTLSTSAFAADASGFTLPSINGDKISLSDFKEDVVVLSFWATWCGPCKEEMPHLEKLYQAHKDEGFTLLSISTDDARSSAQVKPYIKKKKYSFPVLLDRQSKVISEYNPAKTLPFTVIIDKGVIVATHAGFKPGDELELEKQVAALIAGEPEAPADPAPTPE